MQQTTRTVLVTGGMGFIGSALVLHLRKHRPQWRVINFDALTYAGNVENLLSLRDDPLHTFIHGDITDPDAVASVFEQHTIDAVFHLAAESHVDRSIVSPLEFVRTNVEGTVVLLRAATKAWKGRQDARFIHVSTDEVFGELGPEGFFTETTPYAPRSPYAASKACSDHMARSWAATYGLPVIVTNCTNNYGPRQFPEKLLPVVITRAVDGDPVPVYGNGQNVRDWLYVDDHCAALLKVMEEGAPDETYCIGGQAEVSNIEMVQRLLDEVDRQLERPVGTSRALIRFVTDRPGHDFRYAMDISHIQKTLGWSPSVGLDDGLKHTVRWYLDNNPWLQNVTSGAHRDFQRIWYGERLAAADGPS